MGTAVSGASEAKLLSGLGAALHEMSQPMTVLLCALEYASGLESSAEMREMIGAGVEACARLSATVRSMQIQVKQAAERGG
jgi:hypothetical protein